MSAPLIWIALPLLVGFLFLLVTNERLVAYLGAGLALVLAVLAFWLPPDTIRQIGPLTLRIDSTLQLFGRQISLLSTQQIVLVLVYGIGAFWFFGTLAAGYARRIVPFGLVVTALLVASLAVRPFLYAALLIQLAVMLSVPLLVEAGRPAGRGLIRFLIYQTLAMPFILFAGFLLSGVDVGPADIGLVIQAAFLLGLGFAFLLAVFPLYTWIPLLMEESPPYAVGFILVLFPTFSLIFGLNFIDNYSWLRDSPQFAEMLRVVGLLMMVTSGIWAAFQRNLARILAYSIVAETGISLVAVSLPDTMLGLQIFFYLLVPRALALGVWAIAISIFKQQVPDLDFNNLKGLARSFPVATAGLLLANLALIGGPLLASFPIRQVLWERLGSISLPAALWFGVATVGLWLGALRTLLALVQVRETDITPWRLNETWDQRVLIGLGLLGLFVLGLVPHWAQPLLNILPSMFEQLGK